MRALSRKKEDFDNAQCKIIHQKAYFQAKNTMLAEKSIEHIMAREIKIPAAAGKALSFHPLHHRSDKLARRVRYHNKCLTKINHTAGRIV
jgi:hypothetical protein